MNDTETKCAECDGYGDLGAGGECEACNGSGIGPLSRACRFCPSDDIETATTGCAHCNAKLCESCLRVHECSDKEAYRPRKKAVECAVCGDEDCARKVDVCHRCSDDMHDDGDGLCGDCYRAEMEREEKAARARDAYEADAYDRARDAWGER